MPAAPVALLYGIQLHIAADRGKQTSDVICGGFVGPIVHNERVKLRDHHLNRSRKIPPEAVGGCIFDRLKRNANAFLPLDEATASRAVFVIVFGSDGRTETLLEPAK